MTMMTNPIHIDVRAADFEQGFEYSQLLQDHEAGAVVTFVGRVRDFTDRHSQDLWLEHYPAMTEKVLHRIAQKAQSRWPVLSARIIHRVGRMQPGEQIVFVGVSAPHRHDAFHACMFIMDLLKTEAPFWKKEGSSWVTPKQSDNKAADAWTEKH